jgi:hypothetical protein
VSRGRHQSKAKSGRCSSTDEQVVEQDDHRDDQQQVDQSAADVGDQADQPQREQDHQNQPKNACQGFASSFVCVSGKSSLEGIDASSKHWQRAGHRNRSASRRERVFDRLERLFRYSREAVAAVAERHTLQSQTLLSVRTCGFESHPPHHFAPFVAWVTSPLPGLA